MRICTTISREIRDLLSRDMSLNPDNAFCYGVILMPDFSKSPIGCWGSLQVLISGLLKYVYQSNLSCNKACDICKIKCMVIKLIPLKYVNNYEKIAI